MPDTNFSVKAESKTPTKTIVRTRNFKMIIDEPEDSGGTNEGANPVEYLLAAFSGCLNVTAHMIAKEMDIQLENLEINLEGDLNLANFEGKTLQGRPGYKEIRVELDADTDADQKTLNRWLANIKLRCPVYDNINNQTSVKFSVT
ncbi:MAG: OsmC family protein [Halanaerobiaceae bacterium]